MSNKIYEIRDETDDEIYHRLGLYESLEEVKHEILSTPDDEKLSDYYDDDYELINVYECQLGWRGKEKLVFGVRREIHFSDGVADYWTTTINGG